MKVIIHPILQPYVYLKEDLVLLRNKAIKLNCKNVELAINCAIKCIETDAGRNLLK